MGEGGIISVSSDIPTPSPLLQRGIEARPPAKRSQTDGGIFLIQPRTY